MNAQEIQEWAENLLESDSRVDWQKSGKIRPRDIARMVRVENSEATEADLQAICDIINP